MNEVQLQAAYTSATGQPAGRVERLPGGGGNRTYWRVHGGRGPQAIVMELAPGAGKNEEASKDHAPQGLTFVNVRRYLDRIGVRVPRLLPQAARADSRTGTTRAGTSWCSPMASRW